MNENEKGKILDSLTSLDENDKNFVLGYMAGREANSIDAKGVDTATKA